MDIDLSLITDHREMRLLIMCAMFLESAVPEEFWIRAEELAKTDDNYGGIA